LTGGRSVHLTDWVDAATLPADAGLVAAMDVVRDVCSAGSALRKAAKLRTRLPLAALTVVVDDARALAGFEPIVADELNLKVVRLVEAGSPEASAYAVEQRLTVNARAAGPRLGRDVQQVIKASKSGDWSVSDTGAVVCGGIELADGEFSLETVAGGRGSGADGHGGRGSGAGGYRDADRDSATAMLPGGGFVVLDTAPTPELVREGLARDVIRAVQQARKDAGLDVSDRIALTLAGSEVVRAAVEAHQSLVTGETLSTSLQWASVDGLPVELADGQTVAVAVARV
jgi:isoleucyl-tRNA synthetase